MVIIACGEICARANKAMSKMDYTRESRPFVPCTTHKDMTGADGLNRDGKTQNSDLRYFSSLYRSQTLVTNQDSTRPRPSKKDSSLLEEAGVEVQSIAVDNVEKDIIEQALSIRDWVPVALPDQDSLQQIGDRSDALCFLFDILVCPPLTWLTFKSLKLEPPSFLDKRIMELMPYTVKLIKSPNHAIMALTTMTSSIVISIGALAMPVWKSCTRSQSSAFVDCRMLTVAGSLVWSHIGGSIAALFLVFMPFVLGVGVALGLLWHKRMSHA